MARGDSIAGRFLFLFIDGIGLAPASETNPFATVPMPALEGLLGGPLTRERVGRGAGWTLTPLDAALGVPGLPQSATGQTALFTGVNAPERLGRHVAALPGPRLAGILAEHSLFRDVALRGYRFTFANPFTPAYFAAVAAGERRHSATTLAALAAGVPLRDAADLAAGRACSWDITRSFFHALDPAIEEIAPDRAGHHLAAVAAEHDLTLWETFLTDLAGHRRRDLTPELALGRLDGLLSGLLARRPRDLTVLLTSDHGNLEESHHRSHTRNPVPLLAVGPAAPAFTDLTRIDQLAPRLRELLG